MAAHFATLQNKFEGLTNQVREDWTTDLHTPTNNSQVICSAMLFVPRYYNSFVMAWTLTACTPAGV